MTKEPDEKVLFPEVEVEGHVLKPWTLRQAVSLAPELSRVVSVLRDAGLGEALLSLAGMGDGDGTGAEGKVLSALPVAIPGILPLLPRILSVTTGASEEEVGDYDLGKSTRLLLSIATLNAEYLKNFYGPGRTGEATPTP